METVSLGTMMSPLAGGRQRLMTRSLRRVLVISIEPLERAMPILRPAKAEDLVRPGAGGVDHPGSRNRKFLAGDPVSDPRPGDPEAVADQAGDFGVKEKPRPAGFGIPGVFDDEREGIDRPVGDLDGADDAGD